MSVTGIKHTTSITTARSVALVLIFCALLLTSCVSNISSQVKESDKDTTGAFDGTWIANVQKSPARQPMPGNWIANCDGSEWNFRLFIADGVAQSNITGPDESTFVSSSGDFRFDVPQEIEAKARVGSEGTLSLNKQTMVIYGNLKNAKGRYTFAVAQFGNNGCTAIIEFEKADS